MLFNRLLFAAGVFAFCGPMASEARAQTPATPAPQPPVTIKEQVEVVATRVPEAPHDVPASIEVIDGDTLRAIGATDIREALALAAGVDVGPGGDVGPAGAVPEIWGLREFDAFLLVVDDIPWGGAFNPALTTLNLRDVERIEILRGPAPVTYGATSFVGVIHLVHKPAAADRRYLSLRGGSFGSGGAAVDMAIPSSREWKSRLSADVDRQGFKDSRTSFVRGHANYRGALAGSDRKTWLSADLNWLTQHPASPHVREGAALTAVTPLDANYNPANAFLDDTRFSVASGFERPVLGDAKWSLTGSYSHSSQRIMRGFLTDVSNTPNNATGFRENIDIHDMYIDSHLITAERSHVRFVAGGDFLFGNGEGRGAVFTYTTPLVGTASTVTEPSTLDRDTGSRRRFFGGYVSAEWTPLDRLHVSTGLRLNATVERHGEGASTTHARPAGSVGAIVSLWQRGPDHVKVFGNYRDTFKPAAFDFSLAENEGVLKPETARSYEGGVKARAARGRFDLEASGFRMDFKNLVIASILSGVPSLQNAGSTRFQGFEMAADVRGAHSVMGRATYSFHDGKFVDSLQAFGDTNTQLAGNRFEMSARHLFTAGLIVAPSSGLTGDVIVKHVGDRFLNKRNTALAAPFTTVDAGAGYTWNRWELRLDGRNLGNRRDPVSESEIGDSQYYRLNARRADLTFGVRF
jgi:outer membrane receptor protein involved in Fe transport